MWFGAKSGRGGPIKELQLQECKANRQWTSVPAGGTIVGWKKSLCISLMNESAPSGSWAKLSCKRKLAAQTGWVMWVNTRAPVAARLTWLECDLCCSDPIVVLRVREYFRADRRWGASVDGEIVFLFLGGRNALWATAVGLQLCVLSVLTGQYASKEEQPRGVFLRPVRADRPRRPAP